jgi:hypothetical protein
MAKQVIVITGDKELNRAIASLPIENKTRKRIITKSARSALKVGMLMSAKNTAPIKTGFLKKNTKVKAITRSRGSIGAKVSSGLPTKSANTGDAYYGAFLLWGTKQRTTKDGANRGKVSARPWLYDVVSRKKTRVMRRYAEFIKKNIIKVAQGKKI